MQNKLYTSFLTLSEKQRFTNLAKNPFFRYVRYWSNLLCWMLLFLLITGKDYFSWKFIVTLTFFEPPCSCFLWNKRFESSPYFALSPQQQCNINTKFNKNHRYYICYMFYTNFIFDYDLFFDYIWLRIRLF